MSGKLQCCGRVLDLSAPKVMGILNVTPDSFSDGGNFFSSANAIDHAATMIAEGAAIIDVGGESTRPNAQPVSLEEELNRVIPPIEAIRRRFDVLISIDTSKPKVMQAAIQAGAEMVNDVRALQAPGALDVVQQTGAATCLMHMQGEPTNMQQHAAYEDVVKCVLGFLQQRVDDCLAYGISRHQILIDPGFGFGKTLNHNCTLLGKLSTFNNIGLPVLVGLSRKSMIGAIIGEAEATHRIYGSVAAAVIALNQGASILRVHDVKATVDAVNVFSATKQG